MVEFKKARLKEMCGPQLHPAKNQTTQDLARKILGLIEEVEILQLALAPFAAIARSFDAEAPYSCRDVPDDRHLGCIQDRGHVEHTLTYGDFRAARSALGEMKPRSIPSKAEAEASVALDGGTRSAGEKTNPDEVIAAAMGVSCSLCGGSGRVLIMENHVMIPAPRDPGGRIYDNCPGCARREA